MCHAKPESQTLSENPNSENPNITRSPYLFHDTKISVDSSMPQVCLNAENSLIALVAGKLANQILTNVQN